MRSSHTKDTCNRHTHTHIRKWTKCLSISPETLKLGEKSIEEGLQYVGITYDFAGSQKKQK